MLNLPITVDMLSIKNKSIKDQLKLQEVVNYINNDMLQRKTKIYTYDELAKYVQLSVLSLKILVDEINDSDIGVTVTR